MSIATMVSPGVFKEVRALLPVWALSIAALGGSFILGENIPLGLIAYGLGALALGAQSIGQEYSYRTLPLLLSQPIDRRRLLAIKASVLVPMLLTVLVVAALVFRYAYGRDYAATSGLAGLVLALPVLCALLLTPWLTMVCRSSLAGVVFSIALPGVIMTLAHILARSLGIRVDVRVGAILALCAIAGVLGWRRFMRLEAVDATAGSLHLPRIGRAARTHHPLWMLALKELHLQQLTFALVAVYLGMWVALSVYQGVVGAAEIPLDVLTPLYLMLLTLLIGALASAEERQYGTMDWQQLLPVAASHQWMVKVAVVFGLAAVFAIALPMLLGWITGALTGRGESYRIDVALMVIASTAVSLYISSLCRSGMHAAVLSIAIVPFALAVYIPFLRMSIDAVSWPRSGTDLVWTSRFVANTATVALVAIIVALLVRLAYINHRSVDRTAEHVRRQVLLIVLYLAGVAVVFAGAVIGLARR